jgi:hypothetical protein
MSVDFSGINEKQKRQKKKVEFRYLVYYSLLPFATVGEKKFREIEAVNFFVKSKHFDFLSHALENYQILGYKIID